MGSQISPERGVFHWSPSAFANAFRPATSDKKPKACRVVVRLVRASCHVIAEGDDGSSKNEDGRKA